MTITSIGMVLIPLCIYFYLYSQEKLFKLAVFFIPFTGTSFFMLQNAQLANDERGVGIRVGIVLFSLLLMVGVVKAATLSKFHVPLQVRAYLILMLLWVLVVILSQLMPVYISGSFNVADSYHELLTYAKEVPLYYSAQWATQATYFIFGCMVSMFLIIYLSDSGALISAIRIYLYSTIFVCAWGLIEWLLYQLSIPYPYYLFNHNSMNYGGSVELYGIVRVTSVSLEPSILSQQLISALPFFLFRERYMDTILSPLLRNVGLIMVVLVLFLSTSATAYAGLVFVLIGWFFCLERLTYRTVLARFVLAAIALSGLLMLSGYIYDIVMSKLGSYSGVERMMSVMYAIKYFTNYPLLGIGWGVMPSWDLVFCVLAGTGLVGFAVMLVLFARIILALLRLKSQNLEHEYLRRSSLLSFTSLLFVSQLSGFIYHSLYFWFILGIVVAVIAYISRSKTGLVGENMKYLEAV